MLGGRDDAGQLLTVYPKARPPRLNVAVSSPQRVPSTDDENMGTWDEWAANQRLLGLRTISSWHSMESGSVMGLAMSVGEFFDKVHLDPKQESFSVTRPSGRATVKNKESGARRVRTTFRVLKENKNTSSAKAQSGDKKT